MGQLQFSFNDNFTGTAEVQRNQYSFPIGSEHASAYDLAMAGLVSCYYATFMEVAQKKRLEWNAVSIDLTWSKQLDNSPQFLKEARMNIEIDVVKGKETAFTKSLEMAAKYCSLYQTFSMVGELS